jgi:hypothetical protein
MARFLATASLLLLCSCSIEGMKRDYVEKVAKDHPEWSRPDVERLCAREFWKGMTADQLDFHLAECHENSLGSPGYHDRGISRTPSAVIYRCFCRSSYNGRISQHTTWTVQNGRVVDWYTSN